MIRNVCIHVTNEQPLMCDLYSLPSAADAGLVCTNVRSMDGKRPVFIDASASTFFFPYHVVRFLEIPEREMAAWHASDPGATRGGADRPALEGEPADAAHAANGGGREHERGSMLPVAVGGRDDAVDDDLDVDIEIDEGFLQRIRDI